MPTFSQLPLQQAIYQSLTGDATLMDTVRGVYDRPPQDSEYPYVTLGETSVSDYSTKTTTGTEHTQSLHVWSREGGRKEAMAIMERLYQLLHETALSVTGHSVIYARFLSSNLALENDGWTYHATLRFQVLLEAQP